MKTSKTCLSNKNFLSLLDVNSEEIISILELAEKFKKIKRKSRWHDQALKGKVLGMIFQKPSTRTRVSFEAGIPNGGKRGLYGFKQYATGPRRNR